MKNLQSNSKKLAIIGAGTIGLYLGWKLAKKGHQVTIFEKKDIIGKEACSGLFSERILKFIPQSEKLIKNRINSALIHFPKKTIKVKFSKKILVMSHKKLDVLLADLVRQAGAEIVLRKSIVSLPNGYDRIIGCDGANSAIRKSLGLPALNSRLGILGFIQRKDLADYVETWPVRHGFIWKIPRGEETEYGIISEPASAQKILTGFLKERGLRLQRINSAMIPQGFSIPKNNSVTLAGDAAGTTKPWSGGGVVWGLTGAEILLEAFPDFSKYRKLMKSCFGPKIFFSKSATKLVYFLGFKLPWLLPKSIKIESDFLI